jgi:hypothetical protein
VIPQSCEEFSPINREVVISILLSKIFLYLPINIAKFK